MLATQSLFVRQYQINSKIDKIQQEKSYDLILTL